MSVTTIPTGSTPAMGWALDSPKKLYENDKIMI